MQQKPQRKYKYHKQHKNIEHALQKQLKQLQQKLSQQLKSSQTCQKKLIQLTKNITKQKQTLYLSFPSPSQPTKLQLQKTLLNILLQQKQLISHQNDNKQQIINIYQYLQLKKQQLLHLRKQKQNYLLNGIRKQNYGEQLRQIQEIKIDIEKIQDDIMNNDPLKYQQEMRETFYEMNAVLESKSACESRVKEDLLIRQLQESIEKNKLVIELGKYQQLKRQTQQKQQTLKSLIRHSEQIQQRVLTMKKQKKLLKKHTILKNNNEILKQIQQLQQQNQQLQQQISLAQQKIHKQQQYINRCITQDKMKIYYKQLQQLENDYAKLSQKNGINTDDINEDKIKNTFGGEGEPYHGNQELAKMYSELENKKKIIENMENELASLSKSNDNYKEEINILLEQLSEKKNENQPPIPQQQITKIQQIPENRTNTQITFNKQKQLKTKQPVKQSKLSYLFIVFVIIAHIFALFLIYYTFQ